MHYVDSGAGDPVLFVHGSQTWSFMWRGVIRQLMRTHRCIAPDNLGFGLSSKPSDWSYSPAASGRHLNTLVETLDLRNITLVVHDYGGPIGFSFARDHLDRVKRVVVMNTWLWDLAGDPNAVKHGKIVHGPLGKMAYFKMNAAAKLIKPLFADKSKYTESVHKAYAGPFERKEDRCGAYQVAKNLLDCGGWYNELWTEREMYCETPLFFLWGNKDPVFGEKYLNKFWHQFPLCEAKTFEEEGHFLPEEKPQAVADAIAQFMRTGASASFLA